MALEFPGMKVSSTPYKRVNGHDLLVGLLVPENLSPGKHPIIVRFHGGFLVRRLDILFLIT